MGQYHDDTDERNYSRYRESDSFDDETVSHFQFESPRIERQKRNRYGEGKIHHDSYQDDQYRNDYDPTYKDEYGMKHPYEHGGEENRWSDDIRSESSRENHRGKGPRGYVRSDAKILEDAHQILSKNTSLDASGIEISVVDRCIYLKGEVDTRKDKRLAEDLIDDIPGVVDVWNQIKIRTFSDDWQEYNRRGDHPEGPVKGLV